MIKLDKSQAHCIKPLYKTFGYCDQNSDIVISFLQEW